MGNVVVSEALRVANATPLVDHYIASQAAEVGSSYSPHESFMRHNLLGGISLAADCIYENIGTTDPETAWRCYDNQYRSVRTEYDMPPNYYSYDIPDLHGATSPNLELMISQSESWGGHYYHNIRASAGNIINFHNEADRALKGWEFNQLSKPDYLGGPTWTYNWNWNWDCPYSTAECIADAYIPDYEDSEKVTDRYYKDSSQKFWTNQNPISDTSANILAHIIPARTHALGQRATMEGGSEITAHVNLNLTANGFQGFGPSNQGHSAEFFSNYLSRKKYWDEMLGQFDLSIAIPQ